MPLLRPRDADALRAEMRHVASVAGVPIMFGGEVHDDTLLLTEFLGTRTAGLRGLAVRPSAGLGGATVVARRPMSVADYRRASTITHDYDAPVLGEGIRSILAVPVVVDGRARAVLYGAYRRAAPVGDRTAGVMVASARRLGHELSVRDEVDRRLRLREAQLANFGDTVASAEQIREVHAELRRLAADSAPGVRHQLLELANRLGRALSGDTPAVATPLTARELDVLNEVARGLANKEIADTLGISEHTTKGHLKLILAKLRVADRTQAVIAAVQRGIIHLGPASLIDTVVTPPRRSQFDGALGS